jgi:hypothetical protein
MPYLAICLHGCDIVSLQRLVGLISIIQSAVVFVNLLHLGIRYGGEPATREARKEWRLTIRKHSCEGLEEVHAAWAKTMDTISVVTVAAR